MVSADPTQNDNSIETASETTPLLGAPESGDLSKVQHGSPIVPSHEDAEPGDVDEGKPMPLKQILLLCYCAVSEPIAYFAIFPFINEMIELKGQIPEENVGFWSGMIESLFSLVQVLLMIFYGRAADRLGRKPVLVFSLTGVGLATTLFGMSQNLWQMILTRCLAGVFAGSVVTVRTMISENCTKETQGRAFSWYMFVRNTGILLGPLIGMHRYFNHYIYFRLTLLRRRSREPSTTIPARVWRCCILGKVSLRLEHLRRWHDCSVLGAVQPSLSRRNTEQEIRRPVQIRASNVDLGTTERSRSGYGPLHIRPHSYACSVLYRCLACHDVHQRWEGRFRLFRSTDRSLHRTRRRQPGAMDVDRFPITAEEI